MAGGREVAPSVTRAEDLVVHALGQPVTRRVPSEQHRHVIGDEDRGEDHPEGRVGPSSWSAVPRSWGLGCGAQESLAELRLLHAFDDVTCRLGPILQKVRELSPGKASSWVLSPSHVHACGLRPLGGRGARRLELVVTYNDRERLKYPCVQRLLLDLATAKSFSFFAS